MIGDAPNTPALSLEELPDIDLRVNADEVRLEQVIWNLLSNAVKFTPPHGQVTVSLFATDDSLHVRVRDNGQGIVAEALPTVFDIFKQGNVVTNRGIKGLGIGLSLVREIIELHGGKVGVESAGAGQGATFTVSLPRAMDASSAACPQEQPQTILAGLHLLLVDDSDETLGVFSMLLELEGAKVTSTSSARAALQMLDLERFDLVISDLSMPDMDGQAFVAALRQHADYQTTPVLALTGMSRKQDIDGALAAGFSGYVVKPVDIDELARQVRKALHPHATAHDELALQKGRNE
jgi:two-component system CheB/CheR fusion protein